MSKVKKIKVEDLKYFYQDDSYLSIVERKPPAGADIFFKELLLKPFSIRKKILKNFSFESLLYYLDKVVSKKTKNNSFYITWLKEMAEICSIFCQMMEDNSLCLSLETSRGCRRYHMDNVPIRLLVTYYGEGTEWLPANACNYDAYFKGESNNKIIKKNEEIKYIKAWDIAVFKNKQFNGLNKGILHRTPDKAINNTTLLMRLDNSSFLTE